MAIRLTYREDLSEQRGGLAFIVRDDEHPDVEAVVCFGLLAGGEPGLESIEVALAPLRSSTGSFRRPLRKSRRLRPSEVARLPLGTWVDAATRRARQKSEDVQDQIGAIRARLRQRPPEGKGALRRYRAQRRLLQISEAVMRGVSTDEIAREHGLAPSSVRVLIFEARQKGLLPERSEK